MCHASLSLTVREEHMSILQPPVSASLLMHKYVHAELLMSWLSLNMSWVPCTVGAQACLIQILSEERRSTRATLREAKGCIQISLWY